MQFKQFSFEMLKCSRNNNILKSFEFHSHFKQVRINLPWQSVHRFGGASHSKKWWFVTLILVHEHITHALNKMQLHSDSGVSNVFMN